MNVVTLKTDEKDMTRLLELLVGNFAPEHSMGKLSAKNFNLNKSYAWMVQNVEYGAWAVEDSEGKFVGSIGLHTASPWYSDEQYISDGWFYVLPEHRNTGVGKVLLDHAKEFAKNFNLPLIVGVFNSEGTEIKFDIMQRMGMKVVGGLFAAGV
jgi:GNAT superfamily N-acetyltransferase